MNRKATLSIVLLSVLVVVVKGFMTDSSSLVHLLDEDFGIDEKIDGATLDEECGVHTAVLHKNEQSSNSDVIKIMRKIHKTKIWQHRKWPWMVMIKNTTHYLCNGILIRKNFILTTSSCIQKKEPSKVVADLKGQTFKIEKFYKHRDFDPSKPDKLTGDLSLIKLAQAVPVSDKSNKFMSICLPRSKKQPLHAQECAVSFLWVNQKRHEVDTSAMDYNNRYCKDESKKVGKDTLLQCIQTTKGLTPKATSSQVVYFFTCKTSGYWSLFGVSKYHHQTIEENKDNSYTYFLTLSHYLNWMKDIIYNQKPSVLSD